MNYYIVSYLFGIAFASLGFDLSYSIVVVSLGILLFLRVSILRMLFFVLCLILGFFVFQFQEHTEPNVDIEFGKRHEIEGMVASEVIDKVSYKQFVIDTQDYERILVRANTQKDVQFGDGLLLLGVLKEPEAFETESQRVFDYRMYLKKDGIHYILSFAYVLDHRVGELSVWNRVIRFLYTQKDSLIERADSMLPQPHGGLLAGVLYGKQGAMSPELDDDFRAVGLTHIVVLSGYNVSLVIYVLLAALKFLPRGIQALVALIGIILFALMVGAGTTVVRASVMAGIFVFASLVQHKYIVTRSLLIALLVMVSLNPYILLYDLSFQLSFLATFSLVYVSPLLEKYLLWVPEVFELRSSLVATISAQIFVLPLIFYHIGEFSVVSVLVNTLVLFAVPFAMLFGFLLSIFPFEIFSLLTYVFLEYILRVVSFFASYELLMIPLFDIALLFLIYGILFVGLYLVSNEV